MTWAAPATFVSGEIVTAAKLNQNVRDNTNALAPVSADVATQETTASTGYTDLATSGPAVTVATGVTATVFWQARMINNTGGSASYVSVAVSGATTIAANDNWRVGAEAANASDDYVLSGVTRFSSSHPGGALTAGNNTFTLKYRVSGGTGTFAIREIIVIAV